MDERISIDANVCHGKPVIRGTRAPVALVLGSLAGGMSYDEVQSEYELSGEDILAALRFAAKIIEHKEFFALTT